MTQQEALKELENLTIDYGNRTEEEIERLDEAVDMAIAALRADAVDRQTCEDAVSRQQAIDALGEKPLAWTEGEYELGLQNQWQSDVDALKALPSVQPQPVVRCKDCKHWKDSDGVYRRGVDAESKCPLNIQEVYAGTFYCGYAERRTDGRD